MSQTMPEPMSEAMSEPMPEPMSEAMPEMPEVTPGPMSEPVVSGALPAQPAAPKHAGPKAQDGSPASTPWGKAAGAAATPWAQRRGPVRPHATARLRKTIEGLPEWEPLPPGETFVQRGRGDL